MRMEKNIDKFVVNVLVGEFLMEIIKKLKEGEKNLAVVKIKQLVEKEKKIKIL